MRTAGFRRLQAASFSNVCPIDFDVLESDACSTRTIPYAPRTIHPPSRTTVVFRRSIPSLYKPVSKERKLFHRCQLVGSSTIKSNLAELEEVDALVLGSVEIGMMVPRVSGPRQIIAAAGRFGCRTSTVVDPVSGGGCFRDTYVGPIQELSTRNIPLI